MFSQTGKRFCGLFWSLATHCCTSQKIHQPDGLRFRKGMASRRGITVTGRFKTSQSWALQNQPVSWYPFV
jgi:hypothetical protein